MWSFQFNSLTKTESKSRSNFSFSSSISILAAMQFRVSRNARRCACSMRLCTKMPTMLTAINTKALAVNCKKKCNLLYKHFLFACLRFSTHLLMYFKFPNSFSLGSRISQGLWNRNEQNKSLKMNAKALAVNCKKNAIYCTNLFFLHACVFLRICKCISNFPIPFH